MQTGAARENGDEKRTKLCSATVAMTTAEVGANTRWLDGAQS